MAALRAWSCSSRYSKSIFAIIENNLNHLPFAVPVVPPQTYLTLSLRHLGFTTTKTNLLVIPSSVLGMSLIMLMTFVSEIVNSRVAATIVLQFWALPLLIGLYTFNETTSQWIYYGVVSLIAGYPYVHPIQVAWASRNSYSVRTRCVIRFKIRDHLPIKTILRTVSASVYNMFVQASGIVSVSDIIGRRRLQTNVSAQRQIYIVMTTSLSVRSVLSIVHLRDGSIKSHR